MADRGSSHPNTPQSRERQGSSALSDTILRDGSPRMLAEAKDKYLCYHWAEAKGEHLYCQCCSKWLVREQERVRFQGRD